MDLEPFAESVGVVGPVTIAGDATRGGAVPDVRAVRAPAGLDWLQADEMTVQCGAGTLVDDLSAGLREVGQRVALPAGGTVGGALAVGRSGIRALGDGPLRNVLLQARYVGADGSIVKAGGPTVKNVSGFDVCRLLVGSRGTLGFLGEVILRTTPVASCSQWYCRPAGDPMAVFVALHRPVSVLWDGATLWALLEGHVDDVSEQAAASGLTECDAPLVPTAERVLCAPATVSTLTGRVGFIAEVGLGIVHLSAAAASWRRDVPELTASRAVLVVRDRVKQQFDPEYRLNPGVVVG